MGGGRAGFGGVDGEGETGVGDHVDALVGEVEVADHGVVEVLGAGAVEADVVAAPAAAEVARCGWTARRPGRAGPCRGGRGRPRCAGWRRRCRRRRPSRGRSVGGVEVEEGEAGEVGRSAGCAVVDGGVHGPAEVVGGEQVHPAVADDRRGGDRVEHPAAGSAAVSSAWLARRRGRMPALVPSAAWARWNRWARSASSSCRARAMASRTEAETPPMAPRSSLA